MAYTLKRKRPSATSTYNSFKMVEKIIEKTGGDKAKAEDLLSKMYYKIMTVAAQTPGRMVSILPPPGTSLWSWNRSFEIACAAASQYDKAEIPIMVPDEANIFIGIDIIDMDNTQAREALDELDFIFDDEDSGDSEDVLKELIDKESNKKSWLGSFGGELDKARDSLDAITDVEVDIKLSEDKTEKYDWEQEAADIENIVKTAKQDTFANFLNNAMEERALTPARLARTANMMTSTIVKLRNAENPVPTKSQVLALGFALELEREDFFHLLSLAGYCLSNCVPRDIIAEYYLDKQIYDLAQINRALFIHNIPTLGSHAAIEK